MFLPGEPQEGVCYYLAKESEDFCGRPEGEHLVDREGTVKPHPCHVLDLADQGGTSVSNPVCQIPLCGAYRLARVHTGFRPVLVHEEEPEERIPVVLFAGQKPVAFEDIIPAVQAWDDFAAQVRLLIIGKSQNYGEAWREQGWRGNMARILSKTSRLKYMLWCTNPLQSTVEPVEDTLLDIGALAAFLLANRKEDNEWGR